MIIMIILVIIDIMMIMIIDNMIKNTLIRYKINLIQQKIW